MYGTVTDRAAIIIHYSFLVQSYHILGVTYAILIGTIQKSFRLVRKILKFRRCRVRTAYIDSWSSINYLGVMSWYLLFQSILQTSGVRIQDGFSILYILNQDDRMPSMEKPILLLQVVLNHENYQYHLKVQYEWCKHWWNSRYIFMPWMVQKYWLLCQCHAII